VSEVALSGFSSGFFVLVPFVSGLGLIDAVDEEERISAKMLAPGLAEEASEGLVESLMVKGEVLEAGLDMPLIMKEEAPDGLVESPMVNEGALVVALAVENADNGAVVLEGLNSNDEVPPVPKPGNLTGV
jgi:hypothetical protein